MRGRESKSESEREQIKHTKEQSWKLKYKLNGHTTHNSMYIFFLFFLFHFFSICLLHTHKYVCAVCIYVLFLHICQHLINFSFLLNISAFLLLFFLHLLCVIVHWPLLSLCVCVCMSECVFVWVSARVCVCMCLIYDKMPFTFFKRRIFFCTHIRFASVCVYVCVCVGCVYVWRVCVCMLCVCVFVYEFSHSITIYHIHCCVCVCFFFVFALYFFFFRSVF